MNKTQQYDLAVFGGGSGGIGTAVVAGRLGLRVLLVEEFDRVGGTAVWGGVNCYANGVGGTSLPFEIYRKLKGIPQAVGINGMGRHFCFPGEENRFPGGEGILMPDKHYIDTLVGYGAGPFLESEQFMRDNWFGVVFEPEAYCKVVEQMLAEANCDVITGCGFSSVSVSEGRIESVELDDGRTISARFFADCTGNIHLARAAGCGFRIGQDSKSDFNEPSAPDEQTSLLNGVTLVFRVSPRDIEEVDPLEEGIPPHCWWSGGCFPAGCFSRYPNGDSNVNILPTMSGQEFASMEYGQAYEECRRRTLAYWHYVQSEFPEFRKYHITWIAPMLGLREGPRVEARYMLTENDLRADLRKQDHNDIITIADHAMDTHGHGSGCNEMEYPYGIPYGCLLARDIDNLLVACRGAGFSSLAASSCRLSRTMMTLGQAAGTAAYLAVQAQCELKDVSCLELRRELRKQNVELDWTRDKNTIEFLKSE